MSKKYNGVVCTRSQQEGKDYLSREECRDCVQDPSHPCGANEVMLQLLWGESDEEPSGMAFSPTRIQGCMRQKWYTAHNTLKLLYPEKAWSALRGTMAHYMLEKAPQALSIAYAVNEQRLRVDMQTKYGPQEFSGKPDMIEVLYETDQEFVVKIVDWKSVADIPHDMLQAKPYHVEQINMYAFLVRECLPAIIGKPEMRVEVEELEIEYFSMKKYRRFTTKCGMTDKGKMLRPFSAGKHELIKLEPMPLWNHEYARGWIVKGIQDAIEAQNTPQPRLSGDDARICPYCPFQMTCWEN